MQEYKKLVENVFHFVMGDKDFLTGTFRLSCPFKYKNLKPHLIWNFILTGLSYGSRNDPKLYRLGF